MYKQWYTAHDMKRLTLLVAPIYPKSDLDTTVCQLDSDKILECNNYIMKSTKADCLPASLVEHSVTSMIMIMHSHNFQCFSSKAIYLKKP